MAGIGIAERWTEWRRRWLGKDKTVRVLVWVGIAGLLLIGLSEMFPSCSRREPATATLTADQVELVMVPVLDAGAYVSTYKIMSVGGQSSGYEGTYVTVGIYCEHEKKDIVYEMSFDTDLELIGLTADQQRKSLFG